MISALLFLFGSNALIVRAQIVEAPVLPAAEGSTLAEAPLAESVKMTHDASMRGLASAAEDKSPAASALDAAEPRPSRLEQIPALDARYAAPASKSRTVTVMGSSKSARPIVKYVKAAEKLAAELSRRGYNILAGAGSDGIMGAAYRGGNSAVDVEGAGETLGIVTNPPWGDEKLSDFRAVGKAESEAARVDAFRQLSDAFVVFPGGATTLQEASTLIAKNKYRGDAPPKTILLYGKRFFGGLKAQYDRLHKAGLLGAEPKTLFRVVDSHEEALSHFPKLDAAPAPAKAAALSAPPSRDELPAVSAAEDAERDTLSHYERIYLVLKHYLRGRKYSMALRALSFARKYHVGTRKDGVTPEFEHQLSIALYLTTLKDVVDEEKAVTAALLHDVMEDYDISREEMEAEFGAEMTRIVWLLTKKHRGVTKDLTVYFDEISRDPVASLVKGADRIHNVQSMVGVFSLEKQKEYIAEVETYFLPMLKKAGANFPEQTAAYYNIRQMLKSQLQLLKAHHRTLEAQAGKP